MLRPLCMSAIVIILKPRLHFTTSTLPQNGPARLQQVLSGRQGGYYNHCTVVPHLRLI